jgi:hypothetical protein
MTAPGGAQSDLRLRRKEIEANGPHYDQVRPAFKSFLLFPIFEVESRTFPYNLGPEDQYSAIRSVKVYHRLDSPAPPSIEGIDVSRERLGHSSSLSELSYYLNLEG